MEEREFTWRAYTDSHAVHYSYCNHCTKPAYALWRWFSFCSGCPNVLCCNASGQFGYITDAPVRKLDMEPLQGG
jgi:hypothetical protein